MGLCSGKQKKPQNEYSNLNAWSGKGQQEKQQLQITEGNNQVITEKKEPAKLDAPKPVDPQAPPYQQQDTNDEFYLQDIMKQFDELNNLFQQMSEEFENMSKYLASISGE